MKRTLTLWGVFRCCLDDKAEALGIVDTRGADTRIAEEEAGGGSKVEKIEVDKELIGGLMLISKV